MEKETKEKLQRLVIAALEEVKKEMDAAAKKKRKSIAIIFAVILGLSVGIYLWSKPNIVKVKYQEEPINLSNFEYLDTSKSSFVNGAWYDTYRDQMVIRLDKIYYKYCYVPENIWNKFSKASSFGSFYNSNIKGGYDCSKTSEFGRKMAERWEKCLPFGGVEWKDIEKTLKAKGWKDLDGSIWSDPDGNYLPAEALEDRDEVSEAFDEGFNKCMYPSLAQNRP